MFSLKRFTSIFQRSQAETPRIASLFAVPVPPRPAGWWRNDQVEQLRNYQSWVYAAVNAY